MAAASFMSRFLNTTRTALKFKDLVAYGIAHRAEITTHAISLIELLMDVYKDPSCQEQFQNAINILNELQTMPATGLIKLFNKRGLGLDTLLESKPQPVDFEFFARVIPSFVSWIRVQVKTHGDIGPAMLSALTITANAAQRHLSVIIGHYDAFVALLNGHKIDSPLLVEGMTAAKRMKASVEERLAHLRRRMDKALYTAYGPQALAQELDDNDPDGGAVIIPTPTPNDMKELISRLNAGQLGIPMGDLTDDSGSSGDSDEIDELDLLATRMGAKRTSSEADIETALSLSSSSSSSSSSATPEPPTKRPRRGSSTTKKRTPRSKQ